MFLRNCWYVAAWTRELAAAPIGRQIIDEPIVLFRGGDGGVVAMEDRCPHRRAPLSLGRVEGNALRCMYHGLMFGPDGVCLSAPGMAAPPPRSTVRTYPVVEQDSWLWVWLGDVEKADPALIPRAFGIDDPRWVMAADQIDYKANYMLINDNLCDLSHVDFVHETTLAHATGLGWSDSVPRVLQRDRGIRVERWNAGKPMSPTNPKLVDNWSTYDYLAPGVFVMENRSYPQGTAAASDNGAPVGEPMTYRIEQQAVTPISAHETRYFFASGFDARIPAKVLDGIFDVVMAAFTEDRLLIEAQQRVWDRTPPGRDMAFIAHDKGPAMFRRTMARLIKAEQEGAVDVGEAAA